MKKWLSLLLALSLALACAPVSIAQAEEAPTLSILQSYDTKDLNTYPENAPIVDLIEELTGYRLVYECLPSEDAMTKVNLIFASGAVDYDVINVPNPITNYYTLAEEGLLADITDYVQASDNLIAGLDNTHKFFDATAVNGRYYCVPQPNSSNAVGACNWIRSDWLQSLGLELPKTTDEMLAVLRAFKAADASYIPYTQANDRFPTLFAGSFGVECPYADVDGAIVSRYQMKDQMIAYLTYMNTLYAEGLLDKDFVVNTDAIVETKIYGGTAGVFTTSVWSIETFISTFAENQPQGSYELLPYLAGPDGAQGAYTAQGFYCYNVVPASNGRLTEIFDFLNKLYAPDVYCAVYDGLEGVHWQYAEDGSMTPIQPAFGNERAVSKYTFGIGIEYTEKYWTMRLKKSENLYPTYMALQQAAEGIKTNDPTEIAPPIDSVLAYGDALNELAAEYVTKFIVGSLDLSGYDDFLNRWLAAGGQEALDDLNAWYQG